LINTNLGRGYNRTMGWLCLLGLWCSLSVCTQAQETTADGKKVEPPPAPVSQHRFWDRKNILLFSGMAAFRGLDYASTRNFERRGRQEVLLPDDVVNNSAGFASLEVAGAATSLGISYIFHRTGHHKLERWVSIGHIGVTGFGVVRNYSLKSMH
jgi:hypothetical protein